MRSSSNGAWFFVVLALALPLSQPSAVRGQGISAALRDAVASGGTGGTLIPVTDHRDLIFDSQRDLLYITTAGALVQRFDVRRLGVAAGE